LLKEFLLHGVDSGKDFTHILGLVLLILGVLATILPVIFNIVTGRGKFKGQPKSERFILFLVATFVMGVLNSFLGLMLYYQANIFVVGNNVSTNGDKVIEKYYHVESKYNRLEFTLKEPSLYSTILADNIIAPILHEDEQEYQVEYNNRLYKVDK
jgi:hypothetical protein